jgi:hypothetical protein
LVDEFGFEGKGVCISYGPLVDWSIILYWSKFSVFLFDEEEVCFVGTFDGLIVPHLVCFTMKCGVLLVQLEIVGSVCLVVLLVCWV